MNTNALPAMIKAARTRRNLFRLLQAPVTCACGQETLALTGKRLCLSESCPVVWA